MLLYYFYHRLLTAKNGLPTWPVLHVFLEAGQTKLDFTAGMEAADRADGQQLQHRDNKLECCFYSQQSSMSSHNSSNLAGAQGCDRLQSVAYTAV